MSGASFCSPPDRTTPLAQWHVLSSDVGGSVVPVLYLHHGFLSFLAD
jgi:hypothetical protein